MMQLIAILLLFFATNVEGEKPVCPGEYNQCSLHGSCMKDRDGSFICNCEWGWTGEDCSKKLCPHGFNPMDTNKQERKLKLTLSASSGTINGKILLSFHRHIIEMDASTKATSSTLCTEAFRRFQNIKRVECQQIQSNADHGGEYEITLKEFPALPIMNNMFYHNGNPGISDFACDTSQVTGASNVICRFQDSENQNIKEYTACSGQGECDMHAGRCICNEGFYGDNCDSNHDSETILNGVSEGIYFTGTVAKLKTKRHPSKEFKFIDMEAAGKHMMSVDGDGEVFINQGPLHVENGGQIIHAGGLQVTGEVLVKESDVKVTDGRMEIQSSEDLKSALEVQQQNPDFAGIVLDIQSTSSSSHHVIQASTNGQTLLTLDNDGNMDLMQGKLKVSEGLIVPDGGIHVQSRGIQIGGMKQDTIPAGLSVETGSVNVKSGSVYVATGGLLVQNGGAQIGSSSNTQPVMSIEASSTEFASTLLTLQSASASSVHTLLHAQRQNQPIFDLQSDGTVQVHQGGVEIKSGGLRVESGGQTIDSGGLVVKSGGISVESGGFTIHSEGFHIENGGLEVKNSANAASVLQITAESSNFAGAAVVIESNGHSDAKLIEGKMKSERVWSFGANGLLETTGDIITLQNGRIVSAGDLIARGRSVLTQFKVEAGEKVMIPNAHSYVKIVDDGIEAKNALEIVTEGASAGQILLIQNDDNQDTSLIDIPAHTVSIFLFDGNKWTCVSSGSDKTSKSTTEIHQVRDFVENGDMNFGEIRVTAKELQAAGQTATQVAFYGKGGLLSGEEEFNYLDGELHVPAMRVGEIIGRVNMSSGEIANARILGGSLEDVQIHATSIYGSEMHLASNAFVGGGLTVSGPVMGSGAYVDTSDIRFKKNITTLDNSTALIRQLRGVRYQMRCNEFPEKKFPEEEQMGFIADEVEKIIPQVVLTDLDGYKHMAYSHLTPVLTESIKELDTRVSELEQQNQRLVAIIDELKNKLERLDLS